MFSQFRRQLWKGRLTPCFRHVFALFLVALVLPLQLARSADVVKKRRPGSDGHALNGVFRDEFLADNPGILLDVAESPDDPARFETLVKWVLPDELHSTFRITGEFGATRSAGNSDSADSWQLGVAIHCPALELIETAQRLDRLKQLREFIETQPATGSLQSYNRATLLFLVDVAADDAVSASNSFDEVIKAALTVDRSLFEARWPAVLMLRSTLHRPDLRRMVSEFVFGIHFDLLSYVTDLELDVLNDHLRALSGVVSVLDGLNGEWQPELSSQWKPFSYSDSSTRGRGRPESRWLTRAGEAFKVCGHETDFLSFQSPLRGNFEIECDLTMDSGQHISLMQAGAHLQVGSDGASIKVGNFRKQTRDLPLEVPLTKPESWARYRAVSRDGVLTQFVNGAPVQMRKPGPDSDPWFAIRSWRRSQGRVRDLRMTGNPVIPDAVNLISNENLDGWAAYFEEGFGVSGNWSGDVALNSSTEIRGRFRQELAGMAVEKLLRYYRPLFENGTLDLDFFYRAGSAAVYPALDRIAFVLEPDGVRIHEITDRRDERFGADPVNSRDEPEHRRGPARLPLIENDWNHLTLRLDGAVVALSLNGTLIFERPLEPGNQRTFGLFHFADRTEARARNVVWRGDWPKQLPPLDEQPLVSRELDALEAGIAKLPTVLRHDFRDGVPDDWFDFSGISTELQATEHGVLVRRADLTGGNSDLSACVQLHGDFDIVAEFDQLDVQMPEPRWNAGVGLRLTFEDDLSHRCTLFRSTARNAGNRRVSFYQSADRPDESRRLGGTYLVEESRSGRLRLVRHGTTLTGLYASGDSPHYRLIDQLETTTAPTTVRGLTLALDAAPTSRVQTVWKSLLVRAERLTSGPISGPDSVVQRLAERNQSLTVTSLDFSDAEDRDRTRFRVEGGATFSVEPTGVRARASGSGPFAAVTAGTGLPVAAEWDVETAIETHQFNPPAGPRRHSEVSLRVFLVGSDAAVTTDPREASLLWRQHGDGTSELIARIVRQNADRKPDYLPVRSVAVRKLDRLRIAKFEGRLWFLYSESDSEVMRVFADVAVSSGVFSASVALEANAIDDGRLTDVTFQSIRINHSENLSE